MGQSTQPLAAVDSSKDRQVRKPFQYGLASLWGLLTLAALLAWAASILPQFGTTLIVSAVALAMIAGALGTAMLLDAGLGPDLKVRSIEQGPPSAPLGRHEEQPGRSGTG